MKREVEVTRIIEVSVDEEKFDEIFMGEFRKNFYEFNTIEDHMQYLAQLYARGVTDGSPKSFLDGYGFCEDMSIKFRNIDTEVTVV